MSPFASQPIDTSEVSSYFSTYPVRSCEPYAISTINDALKQTIESCTRPGTKERKRALYRHSNPAGNLFSLCLTESDEERIAFVVKCAEFLCIVDDVMEELPHEQALKEHEILCQALDHDSDTDEDTGKDFGRMKQFLRNIRDDVLGIDKQRGQALLDLLKITLRRRDSDSSEFESLERYIPYRIVNFDYEFVCHLIRWSMKIDNEDVDSDLARSYEYSIGVIAGLTNDFFSWNMERQECTDRIRNAVPILMKEYLLSEQRAKSVLKRIILEEEDKATRKKLKLQIAEATDGLKRYVSALEVFAGGYSYWCATCPRYAKPQMK